MAASSTSSLSETPDRIERRPIILVTGANAGLGFATCQRLLLQLSSPLPSDTLPKCTALYSKDDQSLATPFVAPHGCTILLACRNPIKAHKARRALVELVNKMKALPDDVETPTSADALAKWDVPKPMGFREKPARREADEIIEQSQCGESLAEAVCTSLAASKATSRRRRNLGNTRSDREARARGKYRRRFCRGTRIEFVPLDLGSFASVLTCAKQVSERHPYLTHLILNAGGAAWVGLDFFKATIMMLTSFLRALTYPSFKIQRSGDLSQDGIGWVWSINVGGSWMLTQALLPMLRRSPYSTPSRIIWTSSIEALRKYFDLQDMQCLRTDIPSTAYESTKFQCELAALALQEQLQEEEKMESDDAGLVATSKQPSIFLTHPGVIATSIMADYLNCFTSAAMLCAFYIARWLASPHHCVAPYKGAIATCHASLSPAPGRSDGRTDLKDSQEEQPFTRYASRCDIWGREYVNVGSIDTWDSQTDGAGQLVIAESSFDEVDRTRWSNIRGLAHQWRHRTEDICKKVRRESDIGRLPPARPLQQPLTQGGHLGLDWDESENENEDKEESDLDFEHEEGESGDEWQTVEKTI